MEWIALMALLSGAVWLWHIRRRKTRRTMNQSSPSASTAHVLRMGRSIEADEVFHAWTSSDLDQMTDALNKQTNPIDRHFLLMGIVDQAYKKRADPEMAKLCATVAEMHIAEFSEIAPSLKKEMGGVLPRVTTFQKYATLLCERGGFQRAIEVCQEALRYGLHDNTKNGFEGRIARIKKQQKKSGGA